MINHRNSLKTHETPLFVIIEDLEHTARCVAAIRRRRMAEVQVFTKKEAAQ